MSTAAERQRDGVTIVLRDHDPVTDTVAVSSPKRNSAFSGWKLSVDGLL
jgi:hypothetical protein